VPYGGTFRLETGERWTAIETSDFNLFARYLTEGADAIRPVLAERSAIGFNLLRVWTAFWGGPTFTAEIGRLIPSEHPEMYAKLQPFASLCASYGLYVEFTAFCADVVPGHWESLGAALQDQTNVLIELVNEHGAYPSNLDPQDFQPLPGVVCSHGSSASQAVPVRPWWHYETSHWVNVYQWPRKCGHNSLEFSEGAENLPASHVPVIANENTRPDQDGNVNHFYDAAAGAALLCAGSAFHSPSGKKSALFDARDRSFAEAWVAGARSVRLEFQDGRYRHAAELEGPNAGATGERVYQRVLSDGRAETVHIRP
jgi:hypothetical protein